jgi:hypothetical protein
MTISTLLNRACTITHRSTGATVDAYGSEIPATAATATVCELQQQQRTESNERGTVAEDVWLLVLPAGTTIAADDTVTVDGDVFQVHGDPWPVRNPRTQTIHHLEATVRRGQGAA